MISDWDFRPRPRQEVEEQMATRQARRRQQRVAQRRGGSARAKRSRSTTPWWLGPWGMAGAVAVIAIIVIAVIASGQGKKTAGGNFKGRPVAPQTVLAPITNPSPSTLARVGSGGIASPWIAIKGHTTKETIGGKPVIYYYGAEFCPYCAAERWSLIAALARFGKFSDIKEMESTGGDVYPNTNTFSFYGAHYSSPYIVFQSSEVEDRTGNVLETPTPAQQALVRTYDKAPYSSRPNGFPFIVLARRAIAGLPGGSYNEGVLHKDSSVTTSGIYSAPLSWQRISSDLLSPTSPQSQMVYGNANWLTAGICKETNNEPASVCMAAPIPKLEKKLTFK